MTWDKFVKFLPVIMFGYWLGFWFTYAYTWNRDPCGPLSSPMCEDKRIVVSVMRGIFWPATWMSRASIEITKP